MKSKMKIYIKIIFIFTLLFISLTFNTTSQYIEASPSSISENEIEEPQLICKKNELIEIKYSPLGDIYSKIAKVKLDINNNGSNAHTFNIIDRIESINCSTLNMLYNTPYPSKIGNFGNLTLFEWENVTIDEDDIIEYEYLVDSMKEIPLSINSTVLLNNEPISIVKTNDVYITKANISDTITFILNLTNTSQELYTNKKYVTPPLSCIVSISLSEDYYSNIRSEPKTNSTSTIAGKSVLTWYMFVEESHVNISISAKISDMTSWGEVPIDPISVQILSDSSLIGGQLQRGIDSMDASIEMLEGFKNALYGFGDAFSEIGSAIKQIASALGKVKKIDSSFVDILNGIAQSINANYILLNQSKDCLFAANISLSKFLNDDRTVTFLSDKPDLVSYITEAILGINITYSTINQVLNGGEGLPGLYQLYETTLQIAEALQYTNAGLGQIKNGLIMLADGLESSSSSIKQGGRSISEPLVDLKDEKEDIEDLLLILKNNIMKPYDIEIELLKEKYALPINIEIWSRDTWKIVEVETINSESYAQIIYGLSMQFKSEGIPVTPSRVEVLISRYDKGIQYLTDWYPFNITELNQIGLDYDFDNEILYLWPNQRVNASETQNLMIDWLGRPIRIIVESQTEPEIICEYNSASLHGLVQIESTESQSILSIAQAHIIVQNITWPTPLPPQPPPKSWFQILIENIQKPEIQILILFCIAGIIFVVGTLLIRRRYRKKEFEQKLTKIGDKIKTDELLKEIEDLQSSLKEDDSSSD